MTDKHPTDPTALLEAQDLSYAHVDAPVLQQLTFTIGPGLSLVRGGDGRGKTTLLRLMAVTLVPSHGVLRRVPVTVFHEDMADPRHDAVVARAWLEAQRQRFAGWDAGVMPDPIDGFGLSEHIDKPMYMLSTGSRRKVGLLAAAASGARLTLIDTPYAALDAASRRTLSELLMQAAADRHRAWVIADYELAAGLAGAPLSTVIDLGD